MVLATLMLAAAQAGEELTGAVETVAKEPNNPILPTVNEFVWGAITFFLLWALLKFVLLPPIMKGLEARAEKIRTDGAASEAAADEAERLLEEYEASLVTAKAEAVRITEDARAKAEADRREKVTVAEAEAAEIRSRAAQEVSEAKAQAKVELTSSIASIAVGAAEGVVGKSLDAGAQAQLIEDYINRTGSQN